MTKAELLNKLRLVPMNAEVVFVGERDQEYEPTAAFTVTGSKGLVMLLTEGHVPTGYDEVESI